jgi:hypothetical protein
MRLQNTMTLVEKTARNRFVTDPAPASASPSVFSSAMARRVSQDIPFVLRGKKLPVFGKDFPFSERLVKQARFNARMTPIRANIIIAKLPSPLAVQRRHVLPSAVW